MDKYYKELTDKAFSLHQSGSLDEAKNIYEKLLDINPNDYNILNLLGLLYLSKLNYFDAISVLTKASELKSNAYILSNLAKAYFLSDDIDTSIRLYNNAIQLSPSDDIYYSLALAYKKVLRYEEAIDAYKNSIKLNVNNYSALYNLSLLLKERGSAKEALEYSLRAFSISQSDVDLLSLISYLYDIEGQIEQAIYYLLLAIKIDSSQAIFYFNLGVLFSKLNNKVKAIENYLIAIKIDSSHVESYINLANIYKDTNQDIAIEYLNIAYSLSKENENITLLLSKIYREKNDNNKSISVLERYLEINDNNSEIYISLAINYMDLGMYEQALNYYEKALFISPTNLNYLHGKATALKYLDKKNDALEILEKIVASPNASYQSKITLGMMYLTDKKFEKGMELYSLRSTESKLNLVFSNKNLIWKKGDILLDKDILLYSDCGLGDTIMYSRYIPFLKDKCKNITLQTDKELTRILKHNYSNISVIKKSQQISNYDIVLPIMNISWALNMDFSNIPFSNGYLNVDEKGVSKFKTLFEKNFYKLKIGIFVQGNTRVFKNRAISHSEIEKLFDVNNASFYSLQKEPSSFDSKFVNDLSSYIDDYYDTACILKSLDLLVTIDSSIAHMAGALGVKTFLLLPHTPEWRWFNDDLDTPWYNSIKIFKQKSYSDWSDVIARIKYELNNYAKE